MQGKYLILFDCDGTLVDSQYMIHEAMEQAFTGEDLDPPAIADVRRIVGLSLHDAMSALLPKDAASGTANRLVDSYKQVFAELRRSGNGEDSLYEGVAEGLRKLNELDLVLGIATGKSLRGLEHTLDHHRLRSHFSTLQTADTNPGKPDPAMIERAMSEVGAVPETTVMIGDTTYDMMMARAANAAAFGVSWGYHDIQELFDAGASMVAERFEGLTAALEDALAKDEVQA